MAASRPEGTARRGRVERPARAGRLPWNVRPVRNRPASSGWRLLPPLCLFVLLAALLPGIAAGREHSLRLSWVPTLSVDLAFHVDGLGLLFALLVSGIGLLVVAYSRSYLAGHAGLPRFQALLLAFMLAMLGLVLAGSLLTLFVFWELTAFCSYLLIGFEPERRAARAAAQQALLVTGSGGLALLAGLLLVGEAGGTTFLPSLLERGPEVRAHPLYAPGLLLVLVGAASKSALFPLHFWLPDAMEAPTPVSAYLHSAAMVQAGVYLLARMSPVLSGTDLWYEWVGGTGLVTLLVGGGLIFLQTDLKRILAYSTISALGALVLLLGLGTVEAARAAVLFVTAHALYKAALFLVIGAVDRQTGTRQVEELGGLRHRMPLTAGAAVLAGLSLAGMVPFLGFTAKEAFLQAALAAPRFRWLVVAAGALGGALFVAAAAVVVHRPFFGPRRLTPRPAREPGPGFWFGPAVLGLLGLAAGLAGRALEPALFEPAVSAVLGRRATLHPALRHDPGPVLALSGAVLAGGVLLYRWWGSLHGLSALGARRLGRGPAWCYSRLVEGLVRTAEIQTRVLQNGYLRSYLLMILGAFLGLCGLPLMLRAAPASPHAWVGARPHEILLAATILLAGVGAVTAPSRLGAVASLAVVGYGVALVYILFGAPDLAMTQFLVETLTLLLFILVFYHLPPFVRRSPRAARVRDACVALAVGVLMTTLVLLALGVPPVADGGGFYARESLPGGHGRNIVNVILVDFRALDTLGEITVLAAAGAGVYALLKLRRREESG